MMELEFFERVSSVLPEEKEINKPQTKAEIECQHLLGKEENKTGKKKVTILLYKSIPNKS